MNFATKLASFNLDPELVAWLIAQVSEREAALEAQAVSQKELQAQVQAKQAEIESKDQELRNKDLKIQALALELAHHKRMRFGCKSEAFTAEQGDLFQETWQVDLEAIHEETEQLQPQKKRKEHKPAGRNKLPAELPRIEHYHKPDSCQCGQDLVKIGEDISEQLDVEPARFFVHRHIRPQYACRHCECMTAAPVAPALIDGG